nr:immunoglobulin heavy chain junction region [Macaca mulatta]MOW45958.1 immunoglobulin heavy chain junction region [Macaca mulatta]MOW46153.1 immunoglobulin heavy chain junction region [Macaca mulatta]MOW46530.1 immunoglobulin heavy chain junction region [Macaca mulatta]MOW46698.1 immunoglobulin heavy chain junction region [Macaca mulatta]
CARGDNYESADYNGDYYGLDSW